MYCPECGADAAGANYCAQCGADLRDLSGAPRCPDCGSEVADAKFCPDCGADLRRTGGGASVRRTGPPGRRAPRARAPQSSRQASAARRPSKGLSPALIWGGFGVIAVIVVLAIVVAGGGDATSASTTPTGTTGGQPAQPVNAETSGSYGELVQRANGLYDQGASAFDSKRYDQGAEYFRAAAKVYAAAWKKQSTDPNVGTDYATSLFYSGSIDAAVRQVERVLAKSPGFQTGWFNKGNYLSDKARLAEESGDTETAKASYADARAAYEKAIAIDENSSVATQAQEYLGKLPR
jgi:hypothetical protein